MSAPKKHPLSALLAQLVGQTNVIVVHTHIIKLLDNDHLSALFFEQLCYWSERTTDADKWIAKTDADWFEELYLGKKQLIRIRSVLCGRGLIETDVRRSTHYHGQPVLHYRVNLDGLESLLTGISRSAKRELPESDETALPESAKRDISYTESPSETLTEELPVAAKTPATSRPSNLTPQRTAELQAQGKALAQRIAETPSPTFDQFTSSASGMTNADTRLQPFAALMDEITAVWGWDNAGVLTNVAKMLTGKYRAGEKHSEYKAYQFDNPMTAEELSAWASWYRSAHPKMLLPQKPDTIAKSVGEYRAALSSGTSGSGFSYQSAFTFVEE